MRYRSKSNSRHWESVELRRQYLSENPACELKAILRRNGVAIYRNDNSADPHHITGGNGRRWDLRSNLITVCRSAHDWCHANPIDGKILCLWVKLQKSELDAEEFRQVSGMYLAGWLDLKRPTLDWAAPLWRELVDVVSN